MNTERTEKFVNAIACELEEGGFRQVSGTTLRRTLATAVSAALPLLEAGNPVSGLAEQQGVAFDFYDARERFEDWAKGRDLTPDTWGVSSYVSPHVDNDFDVWRVAWKALAATGKQQVGEVVPATFDDGGDYYADQHSDGAWATYLRNGKGWVYNFGQGDDAEIRAKSVARELNRQVAAITARMQVGEVQGERERFEAWAHPIGYRTENQDGYYSRQPTRLAWDVWQAALAARQPGAQESFGWWLQDDNGVGYFSRTMQPAALYAHRATPGYSATPLYAAPPAQGIDLGQLRKLAESMKEIGHSYCATELLALIDSQQTG